MIFNVLQITNVVSAILFVLIPKPYIWILFALQVVIMLIFIIAKQKKHIIHGYFWPLFLLCLILLPWPLPFIIPVVVYLALYLIVKSWREEINWIKWGKIDKGTAWLMVATAVVSSGALILWIILAKPDISDLTSMVPIKGTLYLILAGIVFSTFNSIWEEFILKGILWNGMESVFGNALPIIIFQALLFGLMHLNGFPRGWIGAGMAAVYGFFIGIIRKRSGGILAPVITHFFADATIFGILVVLNG